MRSSLPYCWLLTTPTCVGTGSSRVLRRSRGTHSPRFHVPSAKRKRGAARRGDPGHPRRLGACPSRGLCGGRANRVSNGGLLSSCDQSSIGRRRRCPALCLLGRPRVVCREHYVRRIRQRLSSVRYPTVVPGRTCSCMSLCRHHVHRRTARTAGGVRWLNRSPSKIVVAPKRWVQSDKRARGSRARGLDQSLSLRRTDPSRSATRRPRVKEGGICPSPSARDRIGGRGLRVLPDEALRGLGHGDEGVFENEHLQRTRAAREGVDDLGQRRPVLGLVRSGRRSQEQPGVVYEQMVLVG